MTEKINYTSATIYFPEHEDYSRLKPEKSKVSGDTLEFILHNLVIYASIFPYSVPSEWSEEEIVKRYIIEPTKKLISKDILPSLKEIDKIRQLAKNGKHEPQLYYEVDTWDGTFNVYDSCAKSGELFFETIYDLKMQPLCKLPEVLGFFYKKTQNNTQSLTDLLKLLHLAEDIKHEKEKGKVAYISGRSLKEALQKEIELYENFDFLRSLDSSKE